MLTLLAAELVFRALDIRGYHERRRELGLQYAYILDEEKRASACIACLECEDQCPQSIPISEWMVHVHEVLGDGAPYVCSLP